MTELLTELKDIIKDTNKEIIEIVNSPIFADDMALVDGMRSVQDKLLDLVSRYD